MVTTLDLVEELSTPTRATLHAVGEVDVDIDSAIFAPAHVTVDLDGAPARHFHLVVTGCRLEEVHRGRKRRYVIDLDHELRLLELRSDVRMFQDQGTREIVAAVLDGAGVPASHVTFSLHRQPSKRTYTVQYRETDFAFLSRLLEFEGIWYAIQDDDQSTHVTFGDAQETFTPIDGDSTVTLLDNAHGLGIAEFVLDSTATIERVTLKDYDFKAPDFDLTATISGGNAPVGEHFECPAGYTTAADGEALRRIRLEEILAGRTVGEGESGVLALRAGAWFQLDGPARDALATKYLLRRVEHHVVVHPDEGAAAGEPAYRNRFEAIPYDTKFRPARKTPRPRVRGAHSAVVTGPSGAEIHTDQHGRMKGKFFWDRLGRDDDTSSRWMRPAGIARGLPSAWSACRSWPTGGSPIASESLGRTARRTWCSSRCSFSRASRR